ncbi:hypothetical protein [Emticicia sp. SJ17W-69]|uniref:hypothetical protein n=1 Tax=Emticicia sp. SJ17W-69 TaxID=3421657 RepID=UPI003EB79237
MIREGRFIENIFNSQREFDTKWYPFTKQYYLFSFQVLVAEYEEYSPQNSFFEDLKSAFEQFASSFKFIRFHELEMICPPLFDGESFNRTKEIGIEAVYTLLKRYDETKLSLIFNLSEYEVEEIFSIGISLIYQGIDGEIIENEYRASDLLLFIDNRSGKSQLFISFDWNFGAEWFYNKYKEENIAIVRKAIIDFYESNPDYKELKIDYQLYGFDLELEKYTSKEVIVKKNLG